MRVIVDTNVLLRFVLADDEAQQQSASDALQAAEIVAISVHVFCELAWVMGRVYGAERAAIALAIRLFMQMSNVALDVPAVEAGLRCLDAGGDSADGVIAHNGVRLGGETFLSFDKKAVRLLTAQGHAAKLLGPAGKRTSK